MRAQLALAGYWLGNTRVRNDNMCQYSTIAVQVLPVGLGTTNCITEVLAETQLRIALPSQQHAFVAALVVGLMAGTVRPPWRWGALHCAHRVLLVKHPQLHHLASPARGEGAEVQQLRALYLPCLPCPHLGLRCWAPCADLDPCVAPDTRRHSDTPIGAHQAPRPPPPS